MVDYTFEQAQALMFRIAGDSYFSLDKSIYTQYDGEDKRGVSFCVVIVHSRGNGETVSVAGSGVSWREAINELQQKNREEIEKWS